jgi:hypothetical protein
MRLSATSGNTFVFILKNEEFGEVVFLKRNLTFDFLISYGMLLSFCQEIS